MPKAINCWTVLQLVIFDPGSGLVRSKAAFQVSLDTF